MKSPFRGLCRPNGPPRENQRKQNERLVLTPNQRTNKNYET